MNDKIKLLRDRIKQHQIGAYLIPSNDEYMGEYVPEHLQRLKYATNFSGSNGVLLLSVDQAILFTDGRYLIQARQELDNDVFEVCDLAEISVAQYVIDNFSDDEQFTLGIDPKLFSISVVDGFRSKGISLKYIDENLVDSIWVDKGDAQASSEVCLHYLDYAGQTSVSKRQILSAQLQANNVDFVIITDPETVCWLLNIRGNDLAYTPVVYATVIQSSTGETVLFVERSKLTEQVVEALKNKIIMIEDNGFDAIGLYLSNCSQKGYVFQISSQSSQWHRCQLENNNISYVIADDNCVLLKACKNSIEIEGMISCHVRDGVAIVRFLAYLFNALRTKEYITEQSLADKLLEFRKQQLNFRGNSFSTISAYADNGAVIHYSVDKDTDKQITNKSLYLFDSGGQYLEGTTDVTRTIATGRIKNDYKRHFTLVLKGYIALMTAVFPKGTTGAQLDVLARQYLWQCGLDYAHGTGHGVGSYLSVHEGPQAISKYNNIALQVGMVLSNEPGFYREGYYGIRIESMMLVCESDVAEGFLCFKELTLVPIDTKLIDVNMLTKQEISYINSYHGKVFGAISNSLEEGESRWLKRACKEISSDV